MGKPAAETEMSWPMSTYLTTNNDCGSRQLNLITFKFILFILRTLIYQL